MEEVENNRTAKRKTLIHSPMNKYSPGPMLEIQDHCPTAVFEHIEIALLKMWDKRPGGKLIAIPFNNDVRSQESHENFCTNILTAVAEIVNAENVSISAPTPSEGSKKANKIPISFLIYNITHEQAATLLKRSVWSSRSATFRVALFANICPSFLFMLRGYTSITVKDIFIIIKEVWDSKHTKNFISTLSNSAPTAEKEQVTLELVNLLDSLSTTCLNIKEVGNTLKPCFNIYVDGSNITYDKLWTRLRAFLIGQTYASTMEG